MEGRCTRCAALNSERFLMPKKSSPMTRQAASRIASATSKANNGKIPAGSVASRADATVQRQQAASNAGKTKAG